MPSTVLQSSPPRVLYAIDASDPETFILACAALCAHGYTSDSAAYVSHGFAPRFYLCVEESSPTASQPIPPTAILEEFGTRIAAPSLLCCFGEHAHCLAAHSAAERIAALYRS